MALVGDAAHVASRMVGAGFVSGLPEGAAIIRGIEQNSGTAADSGSRALEGLARTRGLLHSVAQSPYSLA